MSLLNVKNRNKQLRLSHVFDIVKDKCPSYLNETFIYVKDTHSYATRANTKIFRVPEFYGKGNVSFYYSAISDCSDTISDTIKKNW